MLLMLLPKAWIWTTCDPLILVKCAAFQIFTLPT